MNRVHQEFLSRGIYERRARELFEAVDTLSYEECLEEVEKSVKNHWLRYKCPVDRVKHLENYIPVNSFLKSKSLGTYFSRPTYITSEELPKYPGWEETDISNQLPRQSSGRLIEDAYYRESKEKLKRIVPRHNKLSNLFAMWARNQGYQNVIQEENYVDVSFSKNNCTYLAELKVCYGVGSTKSIREALGQLLEYNYYDPRNPADYWLIVLDEKASESDRKFIEKITSEFRLPIFLGWMEDRQFTFSRRLP